MKDQITINGPDGAFGAYIARPAGLPAPAVVVLQELFGVNADIRKHCDELAEQGFIAVAPDLFWRQEPGVDLSVTSEPDWQHGLHLYQAYDRDAGARDVKDTADTAAKMPECTGSIAVVGYCLGALMTFLTAVRYRVDAAVAYHGADTEKYLGELGGSPRAFADASSRAGRVHSQVRTSRDQGGTRYQTQRHSLQLSGSASCLLAAQRRALQRCGGSAGQRTDERISE
jgi:dienelactone hydrolase